MQLYLPGEENLKPNKIRIWWEDIVQNQRRNFKLVKQKTLYLAPELQTNNTDQNTFQKCDIFSAGVIFSEFKYRNESDLFNNLKISKAQQSLIQQMLRTNPNQSQSGDSANEDQPVEQKQFSKFKQLSYEKFALNQKNGQISLLKLAMYNSFLQNLTIKDDISVNFNKDQQKIDENKKRNSLKVLD